MKGHDTLEHDDDVIVLVQEISTKKENSTPYLIPVANCLHKKTLKQ